MADLPVHVGLIEGFYGQVWPQRARLDWAEWSAGQGFGFYIYAPKADPFLRKTWSQPYPTAEMARMRELSAGLRGAGLRFGLGFSPFELYLDWSGDKRRLFEQKLRQLNEIGIDILCLLFDDMKGDVPGLAALQAEIAAVAADVSVASQLILCPTYYSDDPVLEKVFGPAPPNYLEELGRKLDAGIDFFWTGPKVCSPEYPPEHLAHVADRLGRKPFLWDNYPVNDGARMSKHLHLRPFTGRPAAIAAQIAGHAVNPMNQPLLSRIPIFSLAESYRLGADYDADAALRQACLALAGAGVGGEILKDIAVLHDDGREAMGEARRRALLAKYEGFGPNPYAGEIAAFLRGDYIFDPACLTD